MNKTSIEWTHRPGTIGMTWNPIRARDANGKVGWACTHASTGCLHCYAETLNKRWGTKLPFNVPSLELVEIFLDEKILQHPFKARKPCTIFVGDMFDLFHEAIPDEIIARVFYEMEGYIQKHRHVFQVLTKRAERMHSLLSRASWWGGQVRENRSHIWLGVSVENQKYADERIPFLERTPAAIRFLSVEPMLEEIWIEPELMGQTSCGRPQWVICGGESGPGARPFNLAWAESLLKQCRAADVPFFMKQVGSKPYNGSRPIGHDGEGKYFQTLKLKDRKGGDPQEWPPSLRVRQFPDAVPILQEETA